MTRSTRLYASLNKGVFDRRLNCKKSYLRAQHGCTETIGMNFLNDSRSYVFHHKKLFLDLPWSSITLEKDVIYLKIQYAAYL